MRPKPVYNEPDLFKKRLNQIINLKHPLAVLANQIDWPVFEETFGKVYDDKKGRPAIAIRLMVALHYIKYSYGESDESVLFKFIENPYWQYFAGYEYFQHHLPIDPSSMTRFRRRVGSDKLERLFEALLTSAARYGAINPSDYKHINVDTTVQEKAIAFPTDARLYYRMREHLVRYAEVHGIRLRQNYRRLSRKALVKQGRYAHAKQYKRAARKTKELENYLGRVYRDIVRKFKETDSELSQLLLTAERLLDQKKNSKNKLYSIHEPDVDCISKGKSHKRYEFGCKVSIATTSKTNWIIGVEALHGNPYDGHTLASIMKKVEEMIQKEPRHVYVDLGYRGHGYEGDSQIHIVDSRRMKQLTRAVRRWYKRRSAIEPVIGHMKTDNGMKKNNLKGKDGDRIYAIMSACGFNMRKLLAVFLWPKLLWYYIHKIVQQIPNYDEEFNLIKA